MTADIQGITLVHMKGEFRYGRAAGLYKSGS